MSYHIIHDGRDRSTWLRSRDAGVGASEAPILFGLGYADSSELDLYARKLGADVEPIEQTEGMDWGNRLQAPILEALAERAGVACTQNRSLFGNVAHPRLVCTPDAMTADGEPVEAKNICNRLDEEEWEDGIPERFNVQLQSQIAVMEAKRGLFGALLFGGRLVWDWVERDDAMIAEIDRRVAEFWRRVERHDPPVSNGSRSARRAALTLAESRPPTELFEGEIGDRLLEWESLKADEEAAKEALKRAELRRKSIEDELIQRMGSAESAFTVTGWSFRKTEQKRRGYTVEPSVVKGFKVSPPKSHTRAA